MRVRVDATVLHAPDLDRLVAKLRSLGGIVMRTPVTNLVHRLRIIKLEPTDEFLLELKDGLQSVADLMVGAAYIEVLDAGGSLISAGFSGPDAVTENQRLDLLMEAKVAADTGDVIKAQSIRSRLPSLH